MVNANSTITEKERRRLVKDFLNQLEVKDLLTDFAKLLLVVAGLNKEELPKALVKLLTVEEQPPNSMSFLPSLIGYPRVRGLGTPQLSVRPWS